MIYLTPHHFLASLLTIQAANKKKRTQKSTVSVLYNVNKPNFTFRMQLKTQHFMNFFLDRLSVYTKIPINSMGVWNTIQDNRYNHMSTCMMCTFFIDCCSCSLFLMYILCGNRFFFSRLDNFSSKNTNHLILFTM